MRNSIGKTVTIGKVAIVPLLLWAALALVPVSARAEAVQFFLRDTLAPNLPVAIAIVGDSSQRTQATQDLYAAVDRAKAAWLKMQWDDSESELGKINRQKLKGTYLISQDLALAIQKALEVARWSEGKYDPVFSEEDGFLVAKDFRRIQVHVEKKKLKIRSSGIQLDLSHIEQGFLVDLISLDLAQRQWNNSFVELNGIYLAKGNDFNGPWKIPVAEAAEGSARRTFYYKAENLAAATFAPASNEPVTDPNTRERIFSDLQAVTVFARSAAQAQGFASLVYMQGLTNGSKLLKHLSYLKGILIDAKGTFHYIPPKD